MQMTEFSGKAFEFLTIHWSLHLIHGETGEYLPVQMVHDTLRYFHNSCFVFYARIVLHHEVRKHRLEISDSCVAGGMDLLMVLVAKS